jgi:hypothetical protein
MTISRSDAIKTIAHLIYVDEKPDAKRTSTVTRALLKAEAEEKFRVKFEEDAVWAGSVSDLLGHSDLYIKSAKHMIEVLGSLCPVHRAAIASTYIDVDDGHFELDFLLRETIEAVERITLDWRIEHAEAGPMRSGGSKDQRLAKLQKKRSACIAYHLLGCEDIKIPISPNARIFIEVSEILYDLYTGNVFEDMRRSCGEVFQEFAVHKQRHD